MISGIYENWHLWEGSNKKILLSDEDIKKLRQFNSLDDAINFLYMSGHKESARHFNKLKGSAK